LAWEVDRSLARLLLVSDTGQIGAITMHETCDDAR
jgi:hypothetical protein